MINPSDYTQFSEIRYSPWGETRYTTPNTTIPTDRKYTGQREEAALGLYYYNARWYDPALSHFIMADTIIPGAGAGNNPNAIGYLADSNYSALTVDYHENQFLEQLNQENLKRLNDPNANLPGVPTNPLAFDRYAYALNNPLVYTDPSGHDPRERIEHFAAILAPMAKEAESRAWWTGAVAGVVLQIGGFFVEGAVCAGTVGFGCVAGVIGTEAVVIGGAKLAYDLGGGNEASTYEDIIFQINIILTSEKCRDMEDIDFWIYHDPRGSYIQIGEERIMVSEEIADKIQNELGENP